MVEVGADIVLVTLQNLLGEEWLLGLCPIAVTESVTLLISLCSHVDTIFVAKVVPNGIIGIVTGADSVDIEALHNLNILNHALAAHHIATIRVQFVTVSTFYQYGLSIYQQLSVLNLNFAESYFLGDNFNGLLLG